MPLHTLKAAAMANQSGRLVFEEERPYCTTCIKF